MPAAPLSFACATSSGSSMLACSSMRVPSSVAARVVLRRLSFCALEIPLLLAQLVLGEHGLVGIDDDHAVRAVDDQQFVLADQLARVVQRDDRGDVQAARDDRGVRGGAADVGDEARELVLLEQDHVRRRQVVRHQDAVVLRRARRWRRWLVPSSSACEHALDHLDDVGLALAQVRVLDLVELVEQRVHLLLERPLGVAVLGLDERLRHHRQRLVVEDHQVQVEEGLELRRRVRPGCRSASCDSSPRTRGERRVEARLLVRDLVRRDLVVRRPRAARARPGAPARWRCRRRRRCRGW